MLRLFCVTGHSRPPSGAFGWDKLNVTPGARTHLQVQLPDYGPFTPPE